MIGFGGGRLRRVLTRCGSVLGCVLCVSLFAGVVAAPSEASCSNEAFVGFSDFLANCGAYERVTPDFKDGVQVSTQAISRDGSRVVGTSIGVFAGLEGDKLLASYEMTRSGSGWAVAPISPPSRLFPAQEFLDVSSPNADRSLWVARKSSESVYAEDLVVRQSSGSFVVVGPMVPPEVAAGEAAGEYQNFADAFQVNYAGSSADLSHVLFQIVGNGPLWPGDTTAHGIANKSLYEYVGTGNQQPELVGVDNSGRLVSDCGTALGSINNGSYGVDTYNAISSDGETVFFTAAGGGCGERSPVVNEVYARVGQGSGARTVAVSEPSKGDCEVCQTEPEMQAGAEFQGASQDGSKVFFLTAQELFKEDTGMNLYEYDFANRPGHKVVRVATGSKTPEVQGVVRVSEDGSHVYFVARGVLTEGPNGEGDEPVAGAENLYVFERDALHPTGHVAFIATLSEADQQDWSVEDQRPAQATPSGRFLVFQSVADLTNGDASAAPQVFEYDAASEELVRVSVGEPGYPAGMESADTNGASIVAQHYVQAMDARAPEAQSMVSDDGAVVEFQSVGGLTRQARGAGEVGRQSVYEYRSTGSLAGGGVYSVSDGSSQFDAFAEGMDASGGDVLFKTAAPVLAADVDTASDVYDARAGGGFPAPSLAVPCAGEGGCHGSAPVPPAVGVAGSLSVPAGGNLPAGPAVVVKPGVRLRPVSRAQKLARALKACRGRLPRKRRACEVRERKRYGSVKAKGKG